MQFERGWRVSGAEQDWRGGSPPLPYSPPDHVQSAQLAAEWPPQSMTESGTLLEEVCCSMSLRFSKSVVSDKDDVMVALSHGVYS